VPDKQVNNKGVLCLPKTTWRKG